MAAELFSRFIVFKGRRRYSNSKHLKISVKLPENIRFRRCSPPFLPSTDGCRNTKSLKESFISLKSLNVKSNGTIITGSTILEENQQTVSQF